MAETNSENRSPLQQVTATWKSMTQERQLAFGGVALAAIVGFAILIGSGGLQADWTPLTRGLNPEDLKAATAALEAKSIPFKVGDGGTLEVKEEHLHDARLELAVSSMPSGRNIGFELFDQSELGRSAFTEKVNFHRALEGELERTVRHLEPVERARVHLVLPSRSLSKSSKRTLCLGCRYVAPGPKSLQGPGQSHSSPDFSRCGASDARTGRCDR